MHGKRMISAMFAVSTPQMLAPVIIIIFVLTNFIITMIIWKLNEWDLNLYLWLKSRENVANQGESFWYAVICKEKKEKKETDNGRGFIRSEKDQLPWRSIHSQPSPFCHIFIFSTSIAFYQVMCRFNKSSIIIQCKKK